MNEIDFEECLYEILTDVIFMEEVKEATDFELPDRVETFENTGVLTKNRGLVVRFEDGSEFQLTIVQSKRGKAGKE